MQINKVFYFLAIKNAKSAPPLAKQDLNFFTFANTEHCIKRNGFDAVFKAKIFS